MTVTVYIPLLRTGTENVAFPFASVVTVSELFEGPVRERETVAFGTPQPGC